jgi:hypothetical protein
VSEFNKLKSVSINDIERAIAKALSELTSIKYECTISSIAYEVIEGAKFEISVSMQTNFSTPKKQHE